jgi:hypothetical protein
MKHNMAKQKPGQSTQKTTEPLQTTKTFLSDLKQDSDLWYKIHVLIYDLCNIKTDPSAESRTLLTTDELYISGPYFTESESALVKHTIIQGIRNTQVPTETEEITEKPTTAEGANAAKEHSSSIIPKEPKTVEEAIKERLAGFFDKRKASGDSRPCGPHDMTPIYESVFGIHHSELQDERFLGRLRRSGLAVSTESEKESLKEKKKNGRKGR